MVYKPRAVGGRDGRPGIGQLDVAQVQRHARDLCQLLVDSDTTDRKAFLRAFVKRIGIDGSSVTVRYKLPVGPG